MATLKGGDKLEAALKRLSKSLQNGATLEVGFLENSSYPSGVSVPLVAAVNEYGRPKIGQPPRPFFRNMIAAKSGEWPEAIAQLLRDNNYDTKRTLELTGIAIKGQLQQSIKDLWQPPLKPATVQRKGFDKPLIDTSVMLNSVDFVVKD